ncbi:hypothetical protein VN24_20790 [Paenibacillus beijingensis]|uniref:Uncharacterized protein n=2 Tax=Paenibacillus beijingensis TaxID=1126833 RepID=A0A0D5NSL0_9BACL|nr:hypothetical protein VN24_20790 [Paenibacillus beijingensis]
MTYDALKKKLLITLHETPGIGWHTIKKAVDAELWAYERELDAASFAAVGFRKDQAAIAARRWNERAEERSEADYRQLGAVRITILDEEYPDLLKEIPQPPWVLYAMGRIELLRRPAIAVVGTRQPTAYGRHAAGQLARDLAASGLTIVSGMARGIDSRAHEAALEEEGGTIAVLGTSIETIYPRENHSLYRSLKQKGLLVSEYPLGTPSRPGMFPQRNRIIAGLSLGTLVIEAAAGSGSLITADQALDMQRDVFAVPGPINSPKSSATNGLIKQGAKLVAGSGDIMEEYRFMLGACGGTGVRKAEEALETFSKEEAEIYRLLQNSPHTADELHELSGMPFGLLHSVLINLSIKRKIEQQSGSIYMAL